MLSLEDTASWADLIQTMQPWTPRCISFYSQTLPDL